MADPSVSPTTTKEEDLHSAGQRRINQVWEYTQSFIALTVTITFIATKILRIEANALDNTFFVVIGFYFGRTNHQRVGGVELGR